MFCTVAGVLGPLFYVNNMVNAFNVSMHLALSAFCATLVTCAIAITTINIGYLLGTALRTCGWKGCDPKTPYSGYDKCCLKMGIVLSLPHRVLGVSGAIGCITGLFVSILLTNHFSDGLRQPTPAATDSLCAAIDFIATFIVACGCKRLATTICGRHNDISNQKTVDPENIIAHSDAVELDIAKTDFAATSKHSTSEAADAVRIS